MRETDILKDSLEKINSAENLNVNNNFFLISRMLSSIILLILLYLSFESFINSLIMGYEYGGKNNSPMILLFIPGILFIGLLGMKTVFGFKLYNTVLISLFIFYGLLSFGGDNQIINGLEITVSMLGLFTFIYSIYNSKIYGLTSSEVLLLKLK